MSLLIQKNEQVQYDFCVQVRTYYQHFFPICQRIISLQIIPALDPAAPWFRNNTIKAEDADYVEIIHTSPLGISQRGGHNDFYPNKGTSQTGCMDNGCNHIRSYLYLAESLAKDNRLIGQSCRSVLEAMAAGCTSSRQLALGGLQPKRKLGVLYLETNSSPPFAKG